MFVRKKLESHSRRARPLAVGVVGAGRNLAGLGSLCRVCLLACALLFTGCQKGEVLPVELAPEDMCAYCRMAVTEKRYAAQFVRRDGEAFKFDDIGCMSNFVKGRQDRAEIVAYFVMDFESRQWVKAEDAYYVSSPELKSPMGGNTAAFKDEAKAREAVAKFKGRLLRFDELFDLKG